MIELKLRKVGNSVGVILPKEALAHLKAAEGDTVSVTEALEAAQGVVKRYRNALRELAK